MKDDIKNNDKFFRILKKDSKTKARLGSILLPHGRVLTPAFMPVGTNGTVKAIYHDKVKDIGYNLILANTYHLYLRPGTEVLSLFDGIHKFSNWDKNILTDSGGFQIFSLSALRKVYEMGIKFQSHIDGSKHIFTPEKVVDIQQLIGSDIAMVLDICSPYGIDHNKTLKAMDLTHYWAERSIIRRDLTEHISGRAFRGNLFGIVQGGFYDDLRKKSAEIISSMDFPGVAIGGLSVGEPKEVFDYFLGLTASEVTYRKPRYVMGIGSVDYILNAVENGIDLFDCVLATRQARHGSVFTDDGMLNLVRSFNEKDTRPIDENCTCTACRYYSRAYLRHLFKTKEMYAGMLATEHNLTYLYNFLSRIRTSIRNGTFKTFKDEYLYRFSIKKDNL